MWISKFNSGDYDKTVISLTKPSLISSVVSSNIWRPDFLTYPGALDGINRNFLFVDSSIFPDLKLNEIRWIRFCKKEWAIHDNSPEEIEYFYNNVDIKI